MASPTDPRCHTQALIDGLPAHAQDVLNKVLTDSTVPTPLILGVLAEHGLTARAENLNRHRRRLQGGNYACKCPLPTKAAE